jgi:hypothetical protein
MPNHHDHELHDLHQSEIAQLKNELASCRADAAKVVYALNCALQWGEALFGWLPEGTVLSEGVITAKNALQQAMEEIRPNDRSTADRTQ